MVEDSSNHGRWRWRQLNQDKQPNDLTLSSAASCLALPKSTCARLSFTCLCKWTLRNFGVALPNTAVWVCTRLQCWKIIMEIEGKEKITHHNCLVRGTRWRELCHFPEHQWSAAPTPRGILEIQIPRGHPSATQSESLGVRSEVCGTQ